jgi:charged multivesicular body protein 6
MGGTQSSTSTTNNKRVKKAPPAGSGISQVDRAVLDLKNARDRLSKYQKKLELDETRLVERARQAKQKGQTKVALQLLKIKKIKTREVEQVESQLLNVLQMVQTIDSKQNETQVLQAMKTGKDALQKMHEETSVDEVLDLMDQIQEQHEMEREISDILQGVPSLSVEDEAAVEDELEALMQAEGMATSTATEQLPEVPTSKPLPVAPNSKLPEAASTEADQRVAVSS